MLKCARGALLFVTMVAIGCGGAPATAPVEPARTERMPSPSEPSASDGAPLKRLIMARHYLKMIDCGHDDAVGELRCAFSAQGEPQPMPPAETLRLFLAEPHGLQLAATDWEPATMMEDADMLVADCEYEQIGELADFHVGAVKGITGYLYTGRVAVGRASACSFERKGSLPSRLRAAHLVVAHDDARNKPAKVVRTRPEALARARQAAADGATFSKLVARFSDEPGGGRRHGDLGDFKLGAMSAEFELVVLSTPVGGRSPVFETAFGFHIVERYQPKR